MPRFYFLLIIILQCHTLLGKEAPELAADRIAPELLTNANAVVRYYNMQTIVRSQKQVTTDFDYAMTILNEAGKKHASLEFYYSDLFSLEKCEITIYDKNGKRIKKMSKDDMASMPAVLQPGYYDDARIKTYNAFHPQFPYTILVSVQTEQNHTFFLPEFEPQIGADCAVATASYILRSDPKVSLKYKMQNISTPPISGVEGDDIAYRWQLSNIAAYKEESYTVPGDRRKPVVRAVAEEFKIGKYEGKMSTWQDYGKFTYELNKGRDVLPPEINAKVQSLITGVSDRREKISLLYKYLQNNMRYVAIEYGIGGYQTLDAAFVTKNQYGDCKALTNYMMALLKYAGIASYPVLVYAGAYDWKPMDKDFPDNRFNHVILGIPDQLDTLWLECTSQDLPVNYLGNFTQDRDALMITEEGGFVVHTPAYDTACNKIVNRAKASCNSDNSVSIALKSSYSGLPAYSLFNKTDKQSAHEMQKYVSGKFDLPGYDVSKFNYARHDDYNGISMLEDMSMTARNMMTKVGDYSMININLLPLEIPRIVNTGERISDFYIGESVVVVDSFEITLEKNTVCEQLPQPVQYNYAFGSYFCTVSAAGDRLLVYRKFLLNRGSYKSELFGEYVTWLNDVRRDMAKKVTTKIKG